MILWTFDLIKQGQRKPTVIIVGLQRSRRANRLQDKCSCPENALRFSRSRDRAAQASSGRRNPRGHEFLLIKLFPRDDSLADILSNLKFGKTAIGEQVMGCTAQARRRFRSRSPRAADLRMRSASAVFCIVACSSGERQAQASSRVSLKRVTVSASKYAASGSAMPFDVAALEMMNRADNYQGLRCVDLDETASGNGHAVMSGR
jgi:hypothetical protein